MTASVVLQFVLASLLPIVATAGLYAVRRTGRFEGLPYAAKQVLIGILFGGIAIFGTEFGIDALGATMNVRDAAPITAGLVFGGPAGILAGVIGGVERWFAVLWGRGAFTQMGCSIATAVVGVYAAALRHYVFESKKPWWVLALVIGVVGEVFHLMLIFFTNMDQVERAISVVSACTGPMVTCTGISVMLAVMVATLMSHEPLETERERRSIARILQGGMLIGVLAGFAATIWFTYSVQTGMSDEQTSALLSLNAKDVASDISGLVGSSSLASTSSAAGGARLSGQAAGQVAVIARNHRVGEAGGVLVIDPDGEVIGARGNMVGSTLGEVGMRQDLDAATPGELFTTTLLDEPVFAMFRQASGYRIVAVQPVAEARFARDAAVLISAFMEVIVFAGLFTIIYFMVKHQVVDNVHRINDTLGTICDGDLDAQVDVRTSAEFVSLSDRINQTTRALNVAIEDAVARFDTELEYARTIQRSALPMVFPPYPSRTDFDVFASMDAAREVGGDFYDFYLLDDGHLAFVVADVSGKGIPGAMFMMTTKTMLKNLLESGLPVQEAMTGANERLCQNNEAEMFVTVWMGVIDLATGVVRYANAGHNPPLIVRGTEEPEFVKVRPNMVLAGMEGIRYRVHELAMQPGDTLLIYTDGVTEATDADLRLFGEERLMQSVSSRRTQDVESLCRGIRADVDEFVGDAPQFDDITMLALRYLGGEAHAD